MERKRPLLRRTALLVGSVSGADRGSLGGMCFEVPKSSDEVNVHYTGSHSVSGNSNELLTIRHMHKIGRRRSHSE